MGQPNAANRLMRWIKGRAAYRETSRRTSQHVTLKLHIITSLRRYRDFAKRDCQRHVVDEIAGQNDSIGGTLQREHGVA